MKKKFSTLLGSAISIVLFGAAVWFLVHTLRKYNAEQILEHLRNLPHERFMGACLLVIVAYILLTMYDALAFRHIEHPLPYRRIALTSFISYAISNNIGFALLSGSSMRFRLYSCCGLKPIEIVKIIAFCNLTFLLGFLTVGGFTLLLLPQSIAQALPIPLSNLHIIALVFLLGVTSYMALSASERRQHTIGGWVITIPVLRISALQLVLACLDWITTSGILYLLLPIHHLPFALFLCIFLAAQFAGITSNVPGGLGVFETVLLLLMAPLVPEPNILGAIVVYRLIYFIIPLIIAVILFAIHEARQGRGLWRWSGPRKPTTKREKISFF